MYTDKNVKEIGDICVLDKNGYVKASTDANYFMKNLSSEPFFAKLREQSRVSGYLIIGVKDTSLLMWAGNVGYCLLVKVNQVELHKYTVGGHDQLLTVPADVFTHDDSSTTDNWHDVDLGTEQTVDGVTVILNVDGVSLIEYPDEISLFRGADYFQLSNFSSAQSIILASAIELAAVTLTVDKTDLPIGETALLSLSGVMSDGSEADLSGAQRTLGLSRRYMRLGV